MLYYLIEANASWIIWQNFKLIGKRVGKRDEASNFSTSHVEKYRLLLGVHSLTISDAMPWQYLNSKR